jgi:hypothetical protein
MKENSALIIEREALPDDDIHQELRESEARAVELL